MSSEAAYFPDALARTGEVCDGSTSLPEVRARLEGETTEEQAGATTQVSEASDEQLLAQVRDGASEALAFLFRRHARAVRNVAYRILRDEAEADDLVQEVFLFIFRKAALYDRGKGRATTWIIHVAYHRAFDRRRYLNTRHFYASRELKDGGLHLADPRSESSFHEQSLEFILGKGLMAKFNSRLTPEQRETIELFFFEGYALKEIAELTGRSLVNVRSHYYRGLERLRKYVLPEKSRSK
jgi:RNA polymerase sigma-70 factor (ECF subfamily)